jgi:hypothetical protein
VNNRRRLTTGMRVVIFKTAGGRCHICNCRIWPGEEWQADHKIARWITESDDLSEFAPAHVSCHQVKTSSKDVPEAAKAKRIEAKHLGAWEPKGRPMPGTKRSGLKKRMDGRVERR